MERFVTCAIPRPSSGTHALTTFSHLGVLFVAFVEFILGPWSLLSQLKEAPTMDPATAPRPTPTHPPTH